MGFTHADTAIAQATSSVSSQTVTLSAAVSVGDVICLVWAGPAPDSDTVSDTAGNTWVTPHVAANFSKFAYTIITVGAAGGITITTTGGGSGTRFMVADRFSVSGGTATFGASTTGNALSGTSGNLGSLSSVPAGELLWGGGHGDTTGLTFTAGSSNGVNATIGSQVGNTGGSGFSEYILSGAGGTESMTWTANVLGFTSNGGGWEAYFTFTLSARPASSAGRGRAAPGRSGVAVVAAPVRFLRPARVTVRPPVPPPPHGRVTVAVARPVRVVPVQVSARAAVSYARPGRVVVLRSTGAGVIPPPPPAAAAVVPEGMLDRRPGYLKKRILFGV